MTSVNNVRTYKYYMIIYCCLLFQTFKFEMIHPFIVVILNFLTINKYNIMDIEKKYGTKLSAVLTSRAI